MNKTRDEKVDLPTSTIEMVVRDCYKIDANAANRCFIKICIPKQMCTWRKPEIASIPLTTCKSNLIDQRL